MRTPLLSLPGLFLCTALAAAQDAPSLARTIVKLSPQHFTQNSLKAGIERFNSSHSSSFAVFLTGRLENNDYADDHGYDGMAVELQLRKYVSPMKTATSRHGNSFYQGIYGAAYLQGGMYSGSFTDEYRYYDPNTGNYVIQYQHDYNSDVNNWGFGFTIGYHKTLWEVIFMEAFVGGGVQFADRTFSGDTTDPDHPDPDIYDPDFKGILPKIGLHIGIGL